MKNIKDIFDLDNRNSFIWGILEKGIVFDLSKSNLPRVKIPEDYTLRIITLCDASEHVRRQLCSILDPLTSKVAEAIGYGGINFNSAVYEALINAHQHGNRQDPSKKILLADKIAEHKVEVIVADQGGIIDPLFALFVLQQRRVKKYTGDFYDFSRRQKSSLSNKGRGIRIIHSYFSKVSYYRSEDNGLFVHMQKKF